MNLPAVAAALYACGALVEAARILALVRVPEVAREIRDSAAQGMRTLGPLAVPLFAAVATGVVGLRVVAWPYFVYRGRRHIRRSLALRWIMARIYLTVAWNRVTRAKGTRWERRP